MKVKMALKTSQLAVKMALRGAKMAISGVLKYARAYAQDTGFFDFVARRLCLKLLAAKSKTAVFCVCFVHMRVRFLAPPSSLSKSLQDAFKLSLFCLGTISVVLKYARAYAQNTGRF